MTILRFPAFDRGQEAHPAASRERALQENYPDATIGVGAWKREFETAKAGSEGLRIGPAEARAQGFSEVGGRAHHAGACEGLERMAIHVAKSAVFADDFG
ncbi:MAG: hypothetical protein EBS23_02800 [Betaproteobacteria bacterium]|nr:hypothetical protein [Betaproteobacteria bacterium]